ncbi:MAG: hypothetical protein JKP90_06335 [Desulfofustis sp. PB-SRB1]|nr:hypothetical protein [Desulfofustis sp. PB-SRB1]
MVLFVAASVKEIARLGTAYPWNKPSCCPRCGGRGGMDLLSPGLAAFLIVSIFDVCSVRSAAPFIVETTGVLAPVSQFQC